MRRWEVDLPTPKLQVGLTQFSLSLATRHSLRGALGCTIRLQNVFLFVYRKTPAPQAFAWDRFPQIVGGGTWTTVTLKTWEIVVNVAAQS